MQARTAYVAQFPLPAAGGAVRMPQRNDLVLLCRDSSGYGPVRPMKIR